MEDDRRRSKKRLDMLRGRSRESIVSDQSSGGNFSFKLADENRLLKLHKRKDLKTGTSKESMFSASTSTDDPLKTNGYSATSIPRNDTYKGRTSFVGSFTTAAGSMWDIKRFSMERPSLRTAVFDLSPLEERAAKRQLLKNRRVSPFSQDPRKRRVSMSHSRDDASKVTEGKAFYEPLQLVKDVGATDEGKKIYIMMNDASNVRSTKQRQQLEKRHPAPIKTVTVPKRGLIKLTGLPYEFDNPQYYDDRKDLDAPRKYWDHTKFQYRFAPRLSDASSIRDSIMS